MRIADCGSRICGTFNRQLIAQIKRRTTYFGDVPAGHGTGLVALVFADPVFAAPVPVDPVLVEPGFVDSAEFCDCVGDALPEEEDVSGVDPPEFVDDPLEEDPLEPLATQGFPGEFGAFGFPGVPVGDVWVPFGFVVCGAVVEFWPEA